MDYLRLVIHNRLYAIVRLGLVTPDNTVATIFSFCVTDRIAPHFAIRNLCPDMPGLVRSMHFVTGFAASSFPSLMDMQIMEILVAIPEICQRGCELIKGYIIVMAFKAQRIVLWTIGIVELRREILLQDLWVC